MSADSAARGGLLDSVKVLASTLLTVGQTRLELLSNDIEEERAWITSMLVWVSIALFCSALAVILATLLVVVIFWDTYRLLAMGVLIGTFLLGAIVAWRILCKMSKSKPRLFSASIAELSKDRELLATPLNNSAQVNHQ